MTKRKRLYTELDIFQRCFGKVCSMKETYKVKFENEILEFENIIAPVIFYQKNAYKFMYEKKDGKLARRVIATKDNKLDPFHRKKAFSDKRNHTWMLQSIDGIDNDIYFKQYGKIIPISDNICKHVNKNHACDKCKFIWGKVTFKKG